MEENDGRKNYMEERRAAAASCKYDNQIGSGESELRQRRKKRRKPADYYNEDEEAEEEDEEYFDDDRKHMEEILPKWKIFAVGAAIFLCFAILYPSVFAPLIGSFFWGNKGSSGDQRNVHPSMMGAHPNQRDARPGRPMHPHPAAPQMPQQGQGGGGGGRGGFAWLLPFYTIGVVCFLLYTLFKIKFKSKKKKKQKRKGRQKLAMWEDDEDEASDDEIDVGARGQKLHSVQARLRKTEHAMQEILQQLELIANQSEQFRQAQQKEGNDTLAEEKKSTEAQQNPTNIQNVKKKGGLSDEQTTQMEMRLKELKMLSEMVKRDQLLRRRLREHSSSEFSDEEELEEENEQNNEEIDSQTDEESEFDEEAGRRKSD